MIAADCSAAQADGPEDVRVRLGASTYTPAHVLSELAQDAAVTVRAAVAMNPANPPHLDQVISRDPDERVRALLARKLAHLAPTLTDMEQAQACGLVEATLSALVADAAVQVRAAIADCVKAMPDAPRGLVLRLANDEAFPVCGPVIRLSPLLTDADLLSLLTAPPHPGVPAAVASRPGLSAAVADAVATRADSAAVRALLCNRSAAIQEATLDALIDQAEPHLEWHGPLVRRPKLTPRAAKALARFVASHLVEALAARGDMSPADATDLRRRVTAQMESAATPVPLNEAEQLMGAIRRLKAAGALNEATLLDAARAGDRRRVAAALAVASSMPLEAVERAATLRNAKALVSLVWRAGFSKRAAAVVQAMLGQLGPGAALVSGADGAPPLSTDEMEWQLELLAR